MHSTIRLGTWAVLLGLAPTVAHAQTPIEWPRSLRRAIDARAAPIKTARLEALMEWREPDGSIGSTRLLGWECAADRFVLTDYGDPQGPGASREGRHEYRGAERILGWEGEAWRHADREPSVRVVQTQWLQGSGFFDPRQLGLNPTGFLRSLDETLETLTVDPAVRFRFTSRVESGLEVVTAERPEWQWRWWIDPGKQWGVVRTALYNKGVLVGKTEYILTEFDGVWFPSRVEHYKIGDGFDETSPMCVLDFTHASFNQPDHPSEVTPAHIGVEVGTWVCYLTPDDPRPAGRWDGQRVVSVEDFYLRESAGELEVGPGLGQELRRLAEAGQSERGPHAPADRPVAPVGRDFETLWEAHTRSVILRYQLDPQQSQKAWTVCRQCQARGRAYVTHRRHEFEAVRAELSHATLLPGVWGVSARSNARIRERLLLAPLWRIFETELCPRLERLPTRAQRAAAEVTPSTAPQPDARAGP